MSSKDLPWEAVLPRKGGACTENPQGHLAEHPDSRISVEGTGSAAGEQQSYCPEQTLMTLGTCSLGVSSPKQASIPQNNRMEKTMEKSATRARICRKMSK